MKNYVREYRGCRVPVKATHFAEVTGYNHPAFYSDNHIWVIFEDSLHCHQNSCIPKNAFPLPEAPQEWDGEGLPPVGCKCEVDTAESAGLSNRELEINGEEVTVIANVKNKHGYEITVFEAIDGGVFCFSSKLFRPLKTQQEKDREAFIDMAIGLYPLIIPTNDLRKLLGMSFDNGARFTAPKAADNDQK